MKLESNIIILWVLRIIAAAIMIQSLFFKFSGAEESIYIFSTIGIEPWGRILTGIIELIASILLLIPKFSPIGAIIGAGTMFGAIFSHLTILGIEVANDGGQLFIYGVVTFVCCVLILFLSRQKLITLLRSSAMRF